MVMTSCVSVQTSCYLSHFHELPDNPVTCPQVNLHAMTAGVAMLSLYVWLMGLKQCLLARGAGSLPARLAIVSDKGKSSKEAGNLVVKEAVAAMMSHWEAPFRYHLSAVFDCIGSDLGSLPCVCCDE